MDNETINASLRRSIKSGAEYDRYIPKSTCEVQSLGNGKNNTIEGVNFMADWVKQHSHQVKKLAKILQKGSLEETVASIWNFLYHHFQYDADGQLQKLRSPACSWAQRQQGIDCKSYTIFSCALLREIGINSYIRQIKQAGYYKTEFTHVYSIVPINQSKTPDTDYYNKPYYVIDATVSDNKEPKFIEAKDKLMSGLQYQGMKGKVPGCSPRTAKHVTKASNAGRRLYQGKSSGGRDLAKWRHGTLKAPAQNSIITKLYSIEAFIIAIGYSKSAFNAMLQYAYTLIQSGISASQIQIYFENNGFKIGLNRQGMLFKHPYLNGEKLKNHIINTIKNRGLRSSGEGDTSWLEDIDWGSLIDAIGSLFGGGDNGWYKTKDVEANATKLTELYINYITDFNNGIQSSNATQTGQAVVRLKNTAKMVKKAFQKKKSQGWNNSTEQNLQKSIDFANKLQNAINTALNAYLNAYTITTGISAGNIEFNPDHFKQNNTVGLSDMLGLHGTNSVAFSVNVNTGYLPNPNTNVPKFEFSQPVIDSIKNNSPVNTSSFLDTLQDIIVAVSPSPNTGNNQNPSFNPGQNPAQNPAQNQETWNGVDNQMKTSTLLLLGGIAAGTYYWYTNKQKNK